jgi:hypothetical protein
MYNGLQQLQHGESWVRHGGDISKHDRVNAIQPIMGIHRKMAPNVVFGATKYGGLVLPDLEAVKGYRQLEHILGHLRIEDTSVTLYQIQIEFAQLKCGMEEEILSCDSGKYEMNILTPNWITECWQFLKQCDAMIEKTKTLKPHGGTKGCITPMEVFTNRNFTAKEIEDINRCIMYLQAFYISDIADIVGHYIEPLAM